MLLSKHALFPLKCRPNSTDKYVFDQIFIEREYSPLDDLNNVDLIVDCGANVGYASAYFLTKFPNSRVICVEPETSNYEILCENLKPYKNRVHTLKAGVWSHPTELKISDVPYRGGGEWAVQVKECDPGERGTIRAVDIGSILAESGFERISILKMDIEGAEAVVFSRNFENWLPRVDTLVIELHDDSVFGPATDLVTRTVCDHGKFAVSRSGELTIFQSMDIPERADSTRKE